MKNNRKLRWDWIYQRGSQNP